MADMRNGHSHKPRREDRGQLKFLASGHRIFWYVWYLLLVLCLFVISFRPWFVLDDTRTAISIADIILYAFDGPDRDWIMQETGVKGWLFLFTPFLLLPFLIWMVLSAARDNLPGRGFLISLIGFGLVSFGASVAVEDSQHLTIYGWTMPGMWFVVVFVSLLGITSKSFESQISSKILRPLMKSWYSRGLQGSL